MKRTLTMLAKDFQPLKFKAESSFMSEKLDGVRAIWLPFTKGKQFSEIPWANRARDSRNYTCSGLWSRRGKIFAAPEWFLKMLPMEVPLDGELYIGRQQFEKTMSTVRKLEPVDAEWENIQYRIFDIPSYEMFFQTGEVREGGRAGEPAYECFFRPAWIDAVDPYIRSSNFWPKRRFTDTLSFLNTYSWDSQHVSPIKQEQLPPTRNKAEAVINEKLVEITDLKGEGLMLRRGHSIWEPTRSIDLVKVKKLLDSEAEVIGFSFGEGKYLGMIGAVLVRWKGVKFELSGFTDKERLIDSLEMRRFAEKNPGAKIDQCISSEFPLGSTLTFQYNDLTNDGIPKFARYWRKG